MRASRWRRRAAAAGVIPRDGRAISWPATCARGSSPKLRPNPTTEDLSIMRTDLVRRGAVLLVVLLVAVVGAALAQPKGEPIKIGLLTPVTGNLARWGGYAQNGAGLAADEVNSAGGVLGRPVQIVPADSLCQPAQGVSALRRLITSDKVS